MGIFAAIYHPVGIAMLIKSNRRIGFRLGINGVFGNMGVAAAPLIAGILLTMVIGGYVLSRQVFSALVMAWPSLQRCVRMAHRASRRQRRGRAGFAPN